MTKRVYIKDCPNCKKSYAVFCSSRCQKNHMARRRYWKKKEECEDDFEKENTY